MSTGWKEAAERGTESGIWALVLASTFLGRKPTREILKVITAYYFALDRNARRSSRSFLERIHGRGQVSHKMVYGHLLRFAQCTLDRLFFVQGKVDAFDVASFGEAHLTELLDQKRGAILLGAHVGSFEAMQRMADSRDMPINIVGYFRNARMINSVLKRLNPACTARFIEHNPDEMDFILRIRELIEQGQLVSVMADRIQDPAKAAEVDFLGGKAQLPTGPFLLSSVLKCPIYLVFGLHRGGENRYELHCEHFCDELRLPRKTRQQELQKVAQRYAGRLEHYCRLAPDNWFNFFDFWAKAPAG